MLDASTLFSVSAFVTALLGAFLLAVWLQDRSVRALAWWGTAYLMGGSAVALWSGQETFPLLAAWMPNVLLFVACGLVWNGARLFHGRAVLVAPLFFGAAAWFIAMQIPAFARLEAARVVLSSLIIATYTFLTALELRRERRRALSGRFALVGVPLLHGVVFLAPIPLILALAPGQSPNQLFALIALQTLLYVVGTAFIVMVLAKEHVVAVHRTAAMTDPLTGLFNRRAFLDAARKLIARQARERGAVSVLMFDLDHFKSINDRFGHATGDEALRAFGRTAVTSMRGTDVVGRLGGEEFAAILPGGAADAAIVAERVRAAFETAGREFAGHHVKATVSIGAAAAFAPAEIEALLARADSALYRAKAGGRNRAEIAPGESPPTEEQAAPTASETVAAMR